jgi:hypothetical protein
MKSTVILSPVVILSVFSIALALIGGYATGRIQGNKEIKALEAQYAEEDKQAARSVAKLTKDLKDDCQAQKDDILNNMHGGS